MDTGIDYMSGYALDDGRYLQTNGHALVVSSGPPPKGATPATKGMIEIANARMPDEAREYSREALDALRLPKIECSACGGTGAVECRCCDGNGSLTCENANCTREHECRTCDGTGAVECRCCDGNGSLTCENANCTREHECRTCDGNGMSECGECGVAARDRIFHYAVVHGAALDAKYLAPLRLMGSVVRVWGGPTPRDPVYFDDGAMRLVVMPVMDVSGRKTGEVTP
jgi:hypothetical protein